MKFYVFALIAMFVAIASVQVINFQFILTIRKYRKYIVINYFIFMNSFQQFRLKNHQSQSTLLKEVTEVQVELNNRHQTIKIMKNTVDKQDHKVLMKNPKKVITKDMVVKKIIRIVKREKREKDPIKMNNQNETKNQENK